LSNSGAIFFNEVFSGEYEKCGGATIAGRLQQLEDRHNQRRNQKGFFVSSAGDSRLDGFEAWEIPRRESMLSREELACGKNAPNPNRQKLTFGLTWN
jgi:hypothetical protein